MGKEATRIETSILEWAATDPRIAKLSRLNTGLFRMGPRRIRAIENGWPDLIGFTWQGKAILWEVKVEDSLRAEQTELLRLAGFAGCCAGVVRNIEDADRLLRGGETKASDTQGTLGV